MSRRTRRTATSPASGMPAAAPPRDLPPLPESSSFWTRGRLALAVATLITIQVSLAVQSLVQENPTVDEVIHLPAGISYWQTGRFRLYHHNPPLVRMVAALPVLPKQPMMGYGASSWQREPPNKAEFAHEFMQLNAPRYFELFTLARLTMPLFGAIGGLVVFLWSKRLYGPVAGLLSLALWTFCPNILAHTRLITTDAGATAIGALATYAFWRYLKKSTWRSASIAGLLLGIAQITKFTLLVLYGLWPALAMVGLVAGERMRRRCATPPPPGGSIAPTSGEAGGFTIVARVAAQGLWIVALSILVINLCYGFEGVGIPLGDYEFVCQTLTRPVPPGGMVRPTSPDTLLNGAYRFRINWFRGTPLGKIPVPLPREYVLGFDDQKLEAEGIPVKYSDPDVTGPAGDRVRGYPVYLDGELSQTSWWYYYLFALAYKTPEGTILLVILSLGALAAAPWARAHWFDELTVWLVPLFLLFVMSIFTNINLGLRYVLPVFPFIYIAAGRLVPWANRQADRLPRWTARGLVVLGLVGAVGASLTIHPHYLAYFNVMSGGPDHGDSHLIDSNLDWGQDLVGLRRWLARNAPGERVGLAYFGQIHPRIFDEQGLGFDWFLPPPSPGSMPLLPTRYRLEPRSLRLQPGLYAVSATLVRGLPWRVYDRPAAPYEESRWAPWQAWTNAFSYFNVLQPIDRIGHSIYIYRVTEADAERLSPVWYSESRVRPFSAAD
ncbi:MAG: glycosyltransferase family 39 protein [Isosphaeraceae bacterium]